MINKKSKLLTIISGIALFAFVAFCKTILHNYKKASQKNDFLKNIYRTSHQISARNMAKGF